MSVLKTMNANLVLELHHLRNEPAADHHTAFLNPTLPIRVLKFYFLMPPRAANARDGHVMPGVARSLRIFATPPAPAPSDIPLNDKKAIRRWLRQERMRYEYSRIAWLVKWAERTHWLMPPPWRRRVLTQLAACEHQRAEKLALDQRIREQALEEIGSMPEVLTVALYAPANGEVDLLPMAENLWRQGITVCLPCVPEASRQLVFRQWKPGDPLMKHRYGMDEPTEHATICVPDIICAPLVAFDAAGNRLGYGGGFYDATLAHLREAGHHVTVIGLAYDLQEVSELTPEPHDVKLDTIITPSQLLRIAPSVT